MKRQDTISTERNFAVKNWIGLLAAACSAFYFAGRHRVSPSIGEPVCAQVFPVN